MKIHLTILSISVLLISVTNLNSQTNDSVSVNPKDTAWKAGGLLTATFSQSAFDNWSAGGDNSHALNSRVTLTASYELGKVAWENNLDMAYGFTNQKSTGNRKNDDFFDLTSKFGYQASKKWYYSALLNIKSQFAKGYDYSTEPFTDISDFLSPLNINLALGMDYKPDKHLSVFISPANLKFIYVNDTSYSERYNVDQGDHLRTEFGFISKIRYERTLIENLDFLTKLDIFYDYLDPKIKLNDGSDRTKSPYISWEVLLNLKVYKMFSVNLNTHLIYDENYRTANEDGSLKNPRIQFKEVFGIGLSYKF